jgi:hypothetical protein
MTHPTESTHPQLKFKSASKIGPSVVTGLTRTWVQVVNPKGEAAWMTPDPANSAAADPALA